MKIILEQSVSEFSAWSGAIEMQRRLINSGMCNEFDRLIDEIYPEGLSDTQLNDILWFEQDWIIESLGIKDEEEQENFQ